MTKTIILLSYFLAVCSFGKGQEVIYPNNFTNYPHTPTEHERFINAFELTNNAGFLFPLIENIPYNQSNGYYYSSAKLIKTDSDGDVTNTFLVSADTFQKRTYSGGFARVVKDQILFYVSTDSAVQNQTSINKGLIIYHLKESNLSYISSDTLVWLLPTNAALNNWFLLEKGDNSAYCVLDYLTASGNLNSKIYKLVTNSTGTIIDAESKAANLIASADTTKTDFVLSVFWNEGKDSLQFFASYQKPSNMQMWAISTVDTFLNSYQSIDVTGISQNYLYEPNKHLEGSPFVRGRKIGNNKVVIGPYLYETESTQEKIGFLKFDLSNNVYEKGLVIPDSAGLSLPWKTAVIFDNEIKKGDNLFCMGNDFNSYNNFYFEAVENHIYVGKTDTAMNQ